MYSLIDCSSFIFHRQHLYSFQCRHLNDSIQFMWHDFKCCRIHSHSHCVLIFDLIFVLLVIFSFGHDRHVTAHESLKVWKSKRLRVWGCNEWKDSIFEKTFWNGRQYSEIFRSFSFSSSVSFLVWVSISWSWSLYRVSHPPMSISGSREFREILLV
jgi:hypothetical protein